MSILNRWAKKRFSKEYYNFVLKETVHIRKRYAELAQIYKHEHEYGVSSILRKELDDLEERGVEIIQSYGYSESIARYGILLHEKDFWEEPQVNWNSQFELNKQRKAAMSKHYKSFQLKLNL